MAIRTWHYGKVVMVWIWGSVVVGLTLTDFTGGPVSTAPITHLLELATALVILITLSAVTWHWLGGKE